MSSNPPPVLSGPLESDEPHEVLNFGRMPHFYAGAPQWRNGREAGAHLAGIVCGIPEKQANVTVPRDYGDGAIIAMIHGGLQVELFSEDDTNWTFAVRSAYVRWGADPNYSPEPIGELIR